MKTVDLMTCFINSAQAIKKAQSIIITAGAGMGVDSGLPDFRGDRGFWRAYPMYERLGINFIDAANPRHFARDPAFAWGFYGHRTNLYLETVPHDGFKILLNLIDHFNLRYFVMTSNVDGQFQKAGFKEEDICEIHGSLRHLQCIRPCSPNIWDNKENISVNYETMRAEYIPKCSYCGSIARPNILMFSDFSWISSKTDNQEERFDRFLNRCKNEKMVVVEMGAGTGIPAIRNLSERIGRIRGNSYSY